MEKTFYEIIDNFKPVYTTASELLKERGYDDICGLINNAEVEVINTDFDNWNGGIYIYTVYICIPVKQYAPFTPERIKEIERVISQSINEAIKGDDNNSFSVEIIPKSNKDRIDWISNGGTEAKNSLRQDIETMRNIMISVATNGSRIQNEEDRYRLLYTKVKQACNNLHIPFNNAHQSLWDWYGKWGVEFPTYQERRQYINSLFEPTFEAFDSPENSATTDTLIKLDDWGKINRTLVKIKRDSAVAKDEEDFQSVGLLCRELIISLAQAVFNPEIHGSMDEKGVVIGKTDAVRMLKNYISIQLEGGSNEELRSFAQNANKLANRLTHQRNATKKDMMLTVSSTISLINLIGVLEDKY